MVDMATDQQQPDPPTAEPQEPVVEFGPGAAVARPGRSRWNTAGLAAAIANDRRTVPLLAVVAGVARFASLVSEWQVTAIDTALVGDTAPSFSPCRPTSAGWARGWAGLPGRALPADRRDGPGDVRAAGRFRYARLVGLSTGGVLLAMLAALASILGKTSLMSGVFAGLVSPDQIPVLYGRGIWCALLSGRPRRWWRCIWPS